jgi:hypothetical protein
MGDVPLPGRYPCTGHDTVLDAWCNAGGFYPTADPDNVMLLRPAAGDAPARRYKIDWNAITARGEPRANLQLFPGDRLIVGRDKVVAANGNVERMAAPLSVITNQILAYSFAMRNLSSVNQSFAPTTGANPPGLTPAEREAILKEWAGFWWKAASDGPTLDEKTFRQGLIRHLDPNRAAIDKEEK